MHKQRESLGSVYCFSSRSCIHGVQGVQICHNYFSSEKMIAHFAKFMYFLWNGSAPLRAHVTNYFTFPNMNNGWRWEETHKCLPMLIKCPVLVWLRINNRYLAFLVHACQTILLVNSWLCELIKNTSLEKITGIKWALHLMIFSKWLNSPLS